MHTLTFKTRLNSNMLHLFNINDFIGKEVIISIIEWPETSQQKKKKKWNYLGAVELNNKIDHINIRDIAYD